MNSIRSVLAAHHKIMSEMRAILKAMAKVEDSIFFANLD